MRGEVGQGRGGGEEGETQSDERKNTKGERLQGRKDTNY